MTFHVLDHDGNCVASGKSADQAIAQACDATMNSWDSLHRAGWSVSAEKRFPLLGWFMPALVFVGLAALVWVVQG